MCLYTSELVLTPDYIALMFPGLGLARVEYSSVVLYVACTVLASKNLLNTHNSAE